MDGANEKRATSRVAAIPRFFVLASCLRRKENAANATDRALAKGRVRGAMPICMRSRAAGLATVLAGLILFFGARQPANAQTGVCWQNAATGQPIPNGNLVPSGATQDPSDPDRASQTTIATVEAGNPLNPTSNPNPQTATATTNYVRGADGTWTNATTGQAIPNGNLVPSGATQDPSDPDRASQTTIATVEAGNPLNPTSNPNPQTATATTNYVRVPCPPQTATTTGLAAAQNSGTITFQMRTANQPVSGVSIFVLVGANKLPSGAPTGTTDNTGTFVLPPGLLSANKAHLQMEIYVRVCVNGQEQVFVIPKGAEGQVPADTNDCKRRRVGGFYWDGGSTVVVGLGPGGTVTQTGGAVIPHEEIKKVSLQIRGFGGATFVNGNTPSTAGFDGAVLFPLGNRVLVGPTAGFEWVNSSIISRAGSMTVGSTFENESVGFKEGNFGGQIGLRLSGWELGIRGGATVAGSDITQAEGFCDPTAGCTISSTTTTHDTVTGPFVGGYISHSIFSHVGIFVEYDYHRLKDTTSAGTGSSGGSQTIFDLHENSVVGGIVLSFGRHK